MKIYYLTLTIVFFLILSISCKEKEEIKKPNILFILADDFGYHDTGVMGSTYYETPNIDKIATEGMIFTNGYAACQVCSPSRASIMTGKFPARHGITDWIGAPFGASWRNQNRFTSLLPPDYNHELNSEYITLPEALKEVGYKTFFTGKWHLGDKGSYPEDHGFDINIGGWESGSPKGGYFSPWVNPSLPNNKDGENLSMRLADETVKFLKENKDSTFFAFLSFYAVHGPIQTTKEKWEKYRNKAEKNGIAEKGYIMGHYLPIRQVQDNPIYGGLVETMDDAVGKVIKALDELGLAENTIVIFTSDNGGVSAGDSFSTSNLPLRGGKGYQFEGGIREPYFIKVPGIEGGKKCDTPVSGTDFYPTILELVGAKLKPEEHIDGVSLVPLLKGEKIAERPLIWHYPHYGNQGGDPSSIIREGDWKLIHYYEDNRDELYNLITDPYEATDLVADSLEKANSMHEKLFSMLNEMGARFPEKDSEYSKEKEDKSIQRIRDVRWPMLEEQRMEILSKDFDPGDNWWGSNVSTND